MLALQGSEALTQHVIRQPVRLRPNDDKRPLRLLEIENQLSVTLAAGGYWYPPGRRTMPKSLARRDKAR